MRPGVRAADAAGGLYPFCFSGDRAMGGDGRLFGRIARAPRAKRAPLRLLYPSLSNSFVGVAWSTAHHHTPYVAVSPLSDFYWRSPSLFDHPATQSRGRVV